MARTSTARNRSVAGTTREGKIAFMIQAGFLNEAIMSALEHEYPEYIPMDDPRRNPKSNVFRPNLPAFDAIARQRAQEAVRSTRKQDADTDEELEGVIAINGGETGVKPLTESELRNLSRFSTGIHALDYIYGRTKFVHIEDDLELNVEKKRFEGKGRWLANDPLIPTVNGKGYIDTRRLTGKMADVSVVRPGGKEGERFMVKRPVLDAIEVDRGLQKIENGMPESFLSIWAGSPGVGKSRLAVSLTKSLNKVERVLSLQREEEARPVIYYNGEAEESQFRQWSGANIDDELFLASHNELIRLDSIVRDVYKFKPRVVIIDSLQMIAEVKKGSKGAEAVLSRFKLLKADPDAGRPHILFISQLNKKEEMAGSRYLEHMVDFVAKVTRYEGRKGTFLFECARKNRGGETPRGAIFRHTEDGIECISTETRAPNMLKLVQPSMPVPVPQSLGGAAAVQEAASAHNNANAQGFAANSLIGQNTLTE